MAIYPKGKTEEDIERVYKKARRGEQVKLEPRTVFIKTFEITKIPVSLGLLFFIFASKLYFESLTYSSSQFHPKLGKYLNGNYRKKMLLSAPLK